MSDDKLSDYIQKKLKMQLVILGGSLGTRRARRNRIPPQTSSGCRPASDDLAHNENLWPLRLPKLYCVLGLSRQHD